MKVKEPQRKKERNLTPAMQRYKASELQRPPWLPRAPRGFPWSLHLPCTPLFPPLWENALLSGLGSELRGGP